MPLPVIDYLAWAWAHHGRADLELATSGLRPLPRTELGEVEGVDDPATIARFAEALADWLGRPVEEIVPALGTSQALWLAYASATEPGDLVAVEEPGYEPLVRVAEGLGRRVVRLRRRWERAWAIEPAEVERVLADGARLVVLTDLHNPTGVPIGDGVLARVATLARAAGARVLVDEVYRPFDLDRGPRTTRSLDPAIVAIGSLTKAFGLGWARAGWLIGAADVAERARQALRHVVGVNPPAHAAYGLKGLRQIDQLRRRADEVIADKPGLVAEWIAARPDVEWVVPARGLFGFPRLLPVVDDLAFCKELLSARGLLLGPGHFFGTPGHVRLSWGTDRDRLLRGLEALGRALDGLAGGQPSTIV